MFPQREALRHPKQAAGSGTDGQYFQLGLGVVFLQHMLRGGGSTWEMGPRAFRVSSAKYVDV